jgi:hypothetical protein
MQARFQSLSMNNAIYPSIKFKKCLAALPKIQAIYVESCHEYFTEIPIAEDRLSLLESLNYLLRTNPNVPCLFDLPQSEESDMLAGIQSHLGKGSELETRLRRQIKREYHIEEFLTECKTKNIKSVFIGGVYGRACVWDAARTLADTIYSKQLGDKHPNTRFGETDQIHRFQTAVILEDITQGYTDTEATFSHYVCFPASELFVMNMEYQTDIVSMVEDYYADSKTDLLGRSYEAYNNLDESNLAKSHELFTRIQKLISERLSDRPQSFLKEMAAKNHLKQNQNQNPLPPEDERVSMSMSS